jgi:hypothetical protein
MKKGMYIRTGIVIKTDKGLMEHSFVECDIVQEDIRGTSGNQAVEVDLLLLRKSIYTPAQLFIIKCRPEGILQD